MTFFQLKCRTRVSVGIPTNAVAAAVITWPLNLLLCVSFIGSVEHAPAAKGYLDRGISIVRTGKYNKSFLLSQRSDILTL